MAKEFSHLMRTPGIHWRTLSGGVTDPHLQFRNLSGNMERDWGEPRWLARVLVSRLLQGMMGPEWGQWRAVDVFTLE